VLAKQEITSGTGLYSIMMSDADPKLLPNANLTINTDGAQKVGGELLKDTANKFFSNQIINNTHALNPIHSLDKQPARIVTQTGDISSVQVILPKQSIVQSGRDLLNSPIQLQQINTSDASIISARRDIVFATGLDINATPTNNALYQMEISGPGHALVKTGRNLDLGLSTGLTTVGNLSNPALPLAGASLDVLVGLHEGTPSYNAFIEKYLKTNPLYAEQLILVNAVITPFMNQLTGSTLSDADALKEFANLTGDQTLAIQPQLNAILNGVFFNELKLAGSGSAANKSAGNQGGFTAIDTLYPGNEWQGDLTLFFSKLQTINGGDINLLVPGGQINAGLAVAPSGAGAKSAGELGIVAQRQGNINAYVKNDFIVNTSRVFTLGGGDILIWSSEGNIDAGKGAKSALAVTMDPPYYDANDKLVYPAPKITSGSGIRTAGSLGIPAGNVFLFAPKGVVDAGEAGIGGTNVTISATAVLGAGNIQVGGTSTGVPVASVGSVAAGLTGASNATANTSQTAEAATGVDDNGGNQNIALGMLSVELLGFGEDPDQGH
jgi:filamentous hemagglutinin